MSWSVGAIGKSAAVRKSIADQFEKGSKCSEPEEGIRQAAAQAIDAALAGQGDQTAVKVSASGSQSTNGSAVTSNNLTIAIDPIHGYVE